MKKIKSVAVLQEDKTFGEKIPLGTDSDKVDVSTALEETFQTKEIVLEKKTVDGAFEKLLEYAEVTKDEITSALEYTPVKSVNGKTGEEVTLEKADIGLSNVENKSAETILGEMTKQNVVDALGYEPQVNDTQGINLLQSSYLKTGGDTKDGIIGTFWVTEIISHEDLVKMLKPDTKYTASYIFELLETGEVPEIHSGSGKLSLNNGSDNIMLSDVIDRGESWQAGTILKRIGTFTTPADLISNENWRIIAFTRRTDNRNNKGKFYNIKLEPGIVTDPVWTPSPEDVLLKGEADGRNLLTDSKKENLITKAFMIKTSDIFKDYIGEPVCISFDAKINSAGTSRVLNLYAYQNSGLSISNGNDDAFSFIPTEEYQRFSFRSTVKNWGIQNPEFSKGEIIIYDYTGDNNISIKNIKIEIGNAATPWTPAPEDIATHTDVEQAVTGENLVLGSDKKTSNNQYLIQAYKLSSPIELNQTYTVTIFGNIDEGREFVPFFGSDSADRAGELKKVSDGVYRLIFKKTSWSHLNDDKTLLSVFGIPDNSTNAEISRIKLEKGANYHPFWTPSPYDIVSVKDNHILVIGS